jgi:FtsH-binding integral membrane protein
MFVNSFIQLSGFGLIITIGIGIYGVVGLVYATSDVLNNPDYDNPVQGALMLFASLFNIFVTALRLLLRLLASRD